MYSLSPTYLVGLLSLVSTVLAAFHPNSVPLAVVPNAFIIQVDTSASGLSKRSGLTIPALIQNILGGLTDAGIPYTVRHSYDSSSSIFNGASVTVPAGVTGDALAAVSGVVNVWPVRRVPRPVPFSASGEAVPPGAFKGTALKRERRNLKRAAADYSSDPFGPHIQTGVDKTHAAGQLGAGQNICILDAGIDYTNPILGGCFGSGCHVSLGYDFVGDAYDGTNTPVPDSDPFATCDVHGTHVAGTIGALTNTYGFTGVAPLANLGMYRIFGCNGASTDDIILNGYLKAVADGCTVINLSFGSPVNFISSTALELAIDSASKNNGVVTAAAAGNYGTEGMFFAEGPSTARTALAAGSAGVAYLPGFNATVQGQAPINYLSATPIILPGTYKVYFTSTDSTLTTDACSALPASTPNLASYVVFIQRGTCPLTTKFANAVAAGAQVVILYNAAGAAQQIYPALSSGLVAVAGMTRTSGLALLALYKQNPNLVVSFQTATPSDPYNDINAGTMSSFSNYGPSADLFASPVLTAPGEFILSTYPVNQGGVGILSGTSMASPLIAGAAAVVKAARPSLTPAQIFGLLVNTATHVPSSVGGSTYSSIVLQGSGMVQVNAAISAKTLISPPQVFLNDSSYSSYTQTIILKNTNSYAVVYTLSADSAQTLGTYTNGVSDVLVTQTPPVLSGNGKVGFLLKTLIVLPGFSLPAIFTVTPPTLSSSDAAKFPIFSGWITVNEAPLIPSSKIANVKYNVPYFGLVGSTFNMPVIDTSTTIYGPGYAYPFLADDYGIQSAFETYTQPDGPWIYSRQAGATPRISIDLVNATINYTPTIVNNLSSKLARRQLDLEPRDTHEGAKLQSRGLISSILGALGLGGNSGGGSGGGSSSSRVLHSSVQTLGSIYSYTDSSRDYLVNYPTYSDLEIQFTGPYTTTGGVSANAVSGVQYKILIRALKVTGNPTYEDQYESWLSPAFAFA